MTTIAEARPEAVSARLFHFLAACAAWNVALFGLLRLSWTEQHVVDVLIRLQDTIIRWYTGGPRLNLLVASSCSGADVMALCLGLTLAYPVAWRRRLSGALGALLLVLGMNVVRIATLYRAPTPEALDRLHLYVWPVLLTAGVAAYAIWWIRRVDGQRAATSSTTMRLARTVPLSLVMYAAVVPWAFSSTLLKTAGAWTAGVAAAALGWAGTGATASGIVLSTSRGGFAVTPECLFTPVLPLYMAAVLALPLAAWRRVRWLAAAVPLFFCMGVARLLVLALPPVLIDRPAFIVHGFYQIVVGVVLLATTARLSVPDDGSARWLRRTGMSLTVALVAAFALGRIWHDGLLHLSAFVRMAVPVTLAALSTPDEQQGALAMLPVFQVAWLAGAVMAATGGLPVRRLVAALGLLGASQIALLMGAGWFEAVAHAPMHALAIRAWAIGVPIALLFVTLPGRQRLGASAYRRFWHGVGEEFPTLTGAPSTDLYFESERRLIAESLPQLAGLKILKTDLWDEAKNTRILQWVAAQGAHVYGVDISEPIVRQATAAFDRDPLRSAVSDVRALPFADGSFDAIYSMGTVEHFAETAESVRELARVLKPGGRLILGVPNRHDPFLRPVLVWLLSRAGLYVYGAEKCYSRAALRRLLEDAGLEVVSESGVLFIPGWLRMLDLWCHTRARSLTSITRPLVAPFAWLEQHVPAVRRHGYLLASVGAKVRVGMEYVVDAHGCRPADLRSQAHLSSLLQSVVDGLPLRPVAEPVWHVFPGEGGVTGIVLLAESHLTIHTYPEYGLVTLNLYSCRGAVHWPWEAWLGEQLGATRVDVRGLPRGGPPERE